MVESKLREAQRLGFTKVIVPASALKGIKKKPQGIKLVGIRSVKELKDLL